MSDTRLSFIMINYEYIGWTVHPMSMMDKSLTSEAL
jgi:hypothetical protein